MQEVRAADARARGAVSRPQGVPQNLPRADVERIMDEARSTPAKTAEMEQRRIEEARRRGGEHLPGRAPAPPQGEQLDPGQPLPVFNDDGSVKLITVADLPEDRRPPERMRMDVAEGPVFYGRTEEDVNNYGLIDSEPVNPTDAAAKALVRARNAAPLSDHERQQRGET